MEDGAVLADDAAVARSQCDHGVVTIKVTDQSRDYHSCVSIVEKLQLKGDVSEWREGGAITEEMR
jgi:hypothetical protein